jgi:hypothetical protein
MRVNWFREFINEFIFYPVIIVLQKLANWERESKLKH